MGIAKSMVFRGAAAFEMGPCFMYSSVQFSGAASTRRNTGAGRRYGNVREAGTS